MLLQQNRYPAPADSRRAEVGVVVVVVVDGTLAAVVVVTVVAAAT